MLIYEILEKCINRYEKPECEQCEDCSYGEYCPHDCEKCLDYLHNPKHAPQNAPERNMIVFIWLIFIPASTLVGIHQS